MKQLKQKVVWITGASQGIGAALALQCAKEGAKIVLSARNIEKLKEVEKSLNLPANHTLILPIDMTKPEDFPIKTKEVIDFFGQIDILIHNAGISQRAFIAETNLSVYEKLMQVNFFGVVGLTLSVLPYLLKNLSAKIVVISSVSGKLGSPARGGYAASKHALHGFFDSLRTEYDKKIDVLMVCPGYVDTEISYNAVGPMGEKYQHFDENQKRGIAPEILAKKTIRAIKTDKHEISVGGFEVFGIFLKRFFPRLLHKLAVKSAPK
ncbi:MAG: SDR family oxidoreductase [Chitinophagales bacterium]|jgi:short-subunit dehydrogenase|nr:SDR family oxidoreductase [Chitinophagales bacterium]